MGSPRYWPSPFAEHVVEQTEVFVGLFVEKIVVRIAGLEEPIATSIRVDLPHREERRDEAVAHADRSACSRFGQKTTDGFTDRTVQVTPLVLCRFQGQNAHPMDLRHAGAASYISERRRVVLRRWSC